MDPDVTATFSVPGPDATAFGAHLHHDPHDPHDLHDTDAIPALVEAERGAPYFAPDLAPEDADAIGFASTAEVEVADLETSELPRLDEPSPLPRPLAGEPVYLIEVRPPRGETTLLAARTTIDDARRVADAVHPSVADVIIRELPLPCDAVTLAQIMHDLRTWSRDETGHWSAH